MNDSPVSEEFFRTGEWIQNNGAELTSSLGSRQWPSSNETARGCNDTSPSSTDSKNTATILESMAYIGGMNYAKYRLEGSQAKARGSKRRCAPQPYVWKVN